MNEQDADKLLRELFQQSGPLKAPEGLDARILQRIAVMPGAALVPDKALLPKWTWLVAALIVLGIGLVPGSDASTSWLDRIPSYDLGAILSSQWLIMALGALAALLGLDAWLNREPKAEEAR